MLKYLSIIPPLRHNLLQRGGGGELLFATLVLVEEKGFFFLESGRYVDMYGDNKNQSLSNQVGGWTINSVKCSGGAEQVR